MLEQPNEMIKNEKKVTNNYILDTNSKLKKILNLLKMIKN